MVSTMDKSSGEMHNRNEQKKKQKKNPFWAVSRTGRDTISKRSNII